MLECLVFVCRGSLFFNFVSLSWTVPFLLELGFVSAVRLLSWAMHLFITNKAFWRTASMCHKIVNKIWNKRCIATSQIVLQGPLLNPQKCLIEIVDWLDNMSFLLYLSLEKICSSSSYPINTSSMEVLYKDKINLKVGNIHNKEKQWNEEDWSYPVK